MKEVVETVSEVQFRSIALIIAVALLGMVATWWVLTGSASPSLTAAQPEYEAGSLTEVETDTAAKEFPPQQNQPQNPPEIIVEQGNTAVVPLSPSRETSGIRESETADSGFTVQIGAFQQEEGARRRLGELEEQGHEARLISDDQGGTAIYRLVTGEFRTREEATLAAEELRTLGIDAFVRESGTGRQ